MTKFFLNRPVFAIVLSLCIMLLGWVSLKHLPVEQFPSLTPVQIHVSTRLPGASAETMAESVAAPLEQALNGIEGMIYMYSQTVAPGVLELFVFFDIGIDPNTALTNTQNRVNLALSTLPIEVQKQGVFVANEQSNALLFIALQAENDLHDEVFLSNFATTHVANRLDRLEGVSTPRVLNARDYSMRIWLKPDQMAQFGLVVEDVIAAIQEQNGTRTIGLLGAEPLARPNQITLPVNARGRLKDPKEFEQIILRADRSGAMVLLKDVGRVELGAKRYDLTGSLNGKQGSFIAIYQESGANAIDVAKRVKAEMQRISQFFPEGIFYTIPYDASEYIQYSILEVLKTLLEATVLVSLVIYLFLHSLRAALVPMIAMIISVVGTFTGMYLFDFSVNILTLFGLVLSVGIVVDDAIVVIENIERNLAQGIQDPKQAASQAMQEVVGPIIATSCVLAAAFLPVSFIGGIPGKFFKQFAITIACSVLLSGLVALTLSPVLSVILLKKKAKVGKFGVWFDQKFASLTERYLRAIKWVLEHPRVCFASCFAMVGCIGALVFVTPIGFVPHEDQGLVLVSSTLPDGASLSRVEKVSKEIEKVALHVPGVSDILSFSGYSLFESILRTQMGTYFVNLKPWGERKQSAFQIIDQLNEKFQQIPEAQVVALNPPDIPGIGLVGGFDFWVINEGDQDYAALNQVVDQIIAQGKDRPEFAKLLSSIQADGMELFIHLDTAKARSFGVRVDQIYEALQVLLGSVYINQFNKFGHVYQVVAQAEPMYRNSIDDLGDIYVRSDQGSMVPLKSLIIPRFSKGPTLYQRFNGSPAALISVIPATLDSKQIMSTMEQIAQQVLPPQMSYSWGGLAFQEQKTGGMSLSALLGSLLLSFLVLAALYERWTLPISILLAVPFAVFGAFLAIWLTRGIANIYFQIGIIALIGLSAKNAILIVAFANDQRKAGKPLKEAALEGARLRFRAVMMTSLTIVVGMLPLVITSGAGSASRKSVGVGIIGGMAMATFLAILFVPLFYQWIESIANKKGE